MVQATAAPAEALDAFTPRHDFFVGVDSDGCAFDAMEIKHKECFTPNTIKHWRLQAVSSAARETAEFVNLYSTHRGLNRWRALVEVFDLLRARPEPARRGVAVPSGDALRAFIASGLPLSNAGLRAFAAEHPDPELEQALRWTEGVDASIADMVTGVPPFAGVRETLARAGEHADVMVVSATPVEALEREWGEHGLAGLVDLIAGQEMGTKEDHLRRAAVGRYASDRVLLVGDAPGDRAAAHTSGVQFYPIIPGREDESWLRLHDEALDRFFAGTYAGAYADALAAEFAAVLPSTPPWQQR